MNTKKRAEKRRARGRVRRVDSNPPGRQVPLPDTVWCLIIFSYALVVRLIYLFQIDSIPLFYHLAGDGRAYDEWAQRVASGDWLGRGVFYQAPLYPYFLGFLQIIFGHDLWLIRLIQVILGSASCAVIFLVGRAFFSRQAGVAAGLLLASYAPAIFFDGLIEKSILDLVLLSLFLLVVSQTLTGQRWSFWVGTGLLLGLLGLSRENVLILAFVLPVWIGLFFSQEPFAERLRWSGLFLAGLFLVLLPVGSRNLSVGGEFKLTTAQFGANFFIGNNPSADGTYGSIRHAIGEPQLEGRDAARIAEREAARPLSPGEVSDFWFQKSLEYIRSQPAHWFRLLFKKWLLVWNAREIEDSDDFYIYQTWSGLLTFFGWLNHFGILAPLAAAGVWLTRSQWRRLWLLYVMILSLAISVTLFYVFGRYRYPLVPFLVLFAGAGLVQILGLMKEHAWRSLSLVLAGALAVGVAVNWPMLRYRGPGPGGYNNLSNAYYKEGQMNEAVETVLKAIELEPHYGVAHYNLGNLYAAQGRFGLARRHLEEALRLHPNYADATSNLGQLLAEQGDLEAGIPYFRKAIELNSSLTRAHLNLGVGLAKQGRIEDAVQPLQQAVALAPNSAEALYYLGSVYAALSRYEEAAKSFREALHIRADFAQAHESLAQVLSLQGKKKEAAHHHQEALRLLGKRNQSSVFHGP